MGEKERANVLSLIQELKHLEKWARKHDFEKAAKALRAYRKICQRSL